MAIRLNNLYDRKDFFTLTYAGVTLQINEPVGWDKIKITLDRDPDYYGFNFSFVGSDDAVELVFTYGPGSPEKPGGGKLLQYLMETVGSDADIDFQYGYYLLNEANVKYQAKVNLNDYKRDEVGVTASVETVPFSATIRTRFSTKIDVTSVVSLDNLAITPAASFSLKLFSKEIIKKTSSATDPFNLYSDTSGDNTHFYPKLWFQPDTQNILTSEAPLLNAMPPGILHTDPQTSLLYQYQPAETGNADITYTTSGKYQFYNGNNFNFQIVMRQYRGSTLITTHAGTVLNIATSGFLTHSDTFTANFDLVLGDQIYINIEITARIGTGAVNTNWASYSEHSDAITITAKTIAPASNCTAYNIFTLLNHLVYAATGYKDAVASNFFGPGGIGNLYAIANGYSVRNFSESAKPLEIEIQTLIEGMAAIWNISIEYGYSDSGTPIMRVERMPDCFNGSQITVIKNVSSYSEQQNNEKVVNNVTIGYSKYATDEINTLDEFNTVHEYLLPIKTYSASFEKKSDLIASGYSLEIQRREQFQTTPSTSLDNDDEAFIISYHTDGTVQANSNEKFILLDGVVSPTTVYNADITPKQMFYNWSDYFNGMLTLKDSSEIIKNTFAKNNGDLITQLKGTIPTTNKHYYILHEKADVTLSDYNDRDYCYTPMEATFKTYFTWDQFIELMDALQGNTGTDKDHGYISYFDDQNQYWDAHVMKVEYDPGSEEVTLTVRKIRKA